MLEPASTHKRGFISHLMTRLSSRPAPASPPHDFFTHEARVRSDLLYHFERSLPFGLRLDTLLSIVAAAIAAPLLYWLIGKIHASYAEAPPRISVALPAPAAAGWRGTVLASPSIASPAKPGLITCYDPATGLHLDDIPADTRTQIEDKVHAAEKAQVEWGTSSFTRRRRVLRTIKRWCLDDMEGIARLACRDTGKTVSCLRSLFLWAEADPLYADRPWTQCWASCSLRCPRSTGSSATRSACSSQK